MSGQGDRPEADMMKTLAEWRVPGMPDVEQLAAAQRRNFEALSAANKVALRAPRRSRAGTWRSCSSPCPR